MNDINKQPRKPANRGKKKKKAVTTQESVYTGETTVSGAAVETIEAARRTTAETMVLSHAFSTGSADRPRPTAPDAILTPNRPAAVAGRIVRRFYVGRDDSATVLVDVSAEVTTSLPWANVVRRSRLRIVTQLLSRFTTQSSRNDRNTRLTCTALKPR